MKQSLILVLLFAVLSWGGYLLLNARHTGSQAEDIGSGSDPELTLSSVEVPTITTKTRRESFAKENATVNIEYPFVAIASDPVRAADANALIASYIDDRIARFQEHAQDVPAALREGAIGSDLTLRYHVLLVSPTFLSLRFDSSEYIAGAAHPNNETRIVNYDTERHLLLGTIDLFASSTPAILHLSESARRILKERFHDDGEEYVQTHIIPGSAPTYENFREVGLTPEGLLLIFNPYQVAPYARGTVEVFLPFSDTYEGKAIEDILAPRIMSAREDAKTNFREATPE